MHYFNCNRFSLVDHDILLQHRNKVINKRKRHQCSCKTLRWLNRLEYECHIPKVVVLCKALAVPILVAIQAV